MKSSRFGAILIAIAMSMSLVVSAVAQPAWEEIDDALKDAEGRYSRLYVSTEPQTATPDAHGKSPVALASVILVMGSESDAEAIFDLFVEMSEGDSVLIEDLDDVGDEAAIIVEQSSTGDETILLARSGETVAFAIATENGLDRDELADFVLHVFETGPSDESATIADDGTITGGWAEAFPEPEDVDGLESYEAMPVMEFDLPEIPEVAKPVRMSPEQDATPES